MKTILFLITSIIIFCMFIYGLDREIARQCYLNERVKLFPSTVKGCIFAGNCRHYNNLLRGIK